MAREPVAPAEPKRPARRYRRLTLRLDVEVCSPSGRSAQLATTLGAAGLFIQTDAPLPPDTPLELRFRLPGSEQLHEVPGRVVWASPPPAAGDGASDRSPGMGIEFTDRPAINALARELERLG